jgi:oligopeptidase A
MSDNPLLSTQGLHRFDAIAPEHVEPAIAALLAQSQTALDTVTAPAFPAQWLALSATLDVAVENLGVAWGAVSHLNSVNDSPALRAAYNGALPKVTDFFTRLGADEKLYAKYKAMDVASLNAEQQQAHKNAIRNFVLGGAELSGSARERFAQIQERQAELGQKFSENALDATDAFAYYANAEEVHGVPADVLDTAFAAAKAEGKEGVKTAPTIAGRLQWPCMVAPNRALTLH